MLSHSQIRALIIGFILGSHYMAAVLVWSRSRDSVADTAAVVIGTALR